MPKRAEISVFISRQLGPDSPLLALGQAGFRLEGHSLLHLEPLPFELPSLSYDWIFFLSPFGFACFEKSLSQLQGRPAIAAFGPGTAKALAKHGVQVDFTGSGAAAATAEAFLEKARGKRILIPCATNSRDSLYQVLQAVGEIDKIAVYDNQPAPERVPQAPYDVWIFSSPLNAQAYLQARPIDPSAHYIALDPPTAAVLEAIPGLRLSLAAYPAEEALAEVLLQIGRELLPPGA